MRKVAVAIAALFVLSIVAPAFSQPFADVPTDHWAFDAIAELAAKGIVEGYPDGTFKGDRAMTRYEMAMVVARLLARVEAIKIPAPAPPAKVPPPEVGRADIQTLQRLVNEFRAELAALGVRVTAVEEELAALRARLDNTFVTGDLTYAYVTPHTSGSGGLAAPEVQRNRVRLTFRGRVGSHVSTFLRARWNSTFDTGGVSALTPDLDRVYLDYAAPFGLAFRVGREYWSLGPTGILLVGRASREGARATTTFGPVSLTGLGFFNQHGGPSSSTYGARAQLQPIAGWNFGFNYRTDRDYSGVVLGTYATTGAYTGSGWSVDWSGNIIPGFSFTGEYATFTPTAGCAPPAAPAGTSTGCTALLARLDINLGQVTGMTQFAPSLGIWYKNNQSNYKTNSGSGQASVFCCDQLFWNGGTGDGLVSEWGASMSLSNVLANTNVLFAWSSGTNNSATAIPGSPGTVAQGAKYSAIQASVTYNLGHNGSASVEYHNLRNTTTSTQVEQLWALVLRSNW